MKILLGYISGMPDRSDPFVTMLPTGLCYLHSTLIQAGFDSTLVNLSGYSDSEKRTLIAGQNPSIFCISQWTHNRHASLELADLVKKIFPKCLVIVGGGHATFQYKEILCKNASVDLVVIGEGEATLLELAECCKAGRSMDQVNGIAYCKSGQVVITPQRKLLENLDMVPFSSLHLERSIGLDMEFQAEFIVTSRGCPSACRFCSSPVFWNKRVRFRSPENIVEEVLFIRERLGLIYFSFRDDTFTADRARTIAFCRLLIERNAGIVWNCQSRVTALDEELLVWMKLAGCECVQLGVESGSPATLDLLGKKITPEQVETASALVRKVGIQLSVYLISDIPGESEDDIKATLSLMRRISPDDGYVSPLAYYPGTSLFAEAVNSGNVSADIFQKKHANALYAMPKPGKNASRYLKALSGNVSAGPKEFEKQKHLLGYCYTSNIIAGEYYRQNNDFRLAEEEFREITVKSPENPWGWYLLAELFAEAGKKSKVQEFYCKVLEIIPKHGPSLASVKSIKKRDLKGPAV